MDEVKILFSNHAVTQMFQRSISVEDVKYVLQNGIIVNEYPYDRPYPSRLLYAVCNKRALHIVCSENKIENTVIVITTYEPSTDIWQNDNKTRKK